MKLTHNIYKSYAKIAVTISIIISAFHMLNVSGILVFSTMPIRVLHLMAMIMIVFLMSKKGKESRYPSADLLVRSLSAIVALASSVYILYRWEAIISSGGLTNDLDMIMGILMVLVVLEATRRSAGNALAVITIIFLLYPFVGPYLPSIFRNRAYSMSRIFAFLFTTTEGIYGIPIGVSTTFIILFCIYGAFLSEFGAGEFLFKVSSSVTSKFVAATAKTSIIFSALIGMISGSAAGNVAITGSLTIPMMIKSGYKPEKAGAISAVAATGGQIMPPIMGAAAFMMSEMVGVPYATIMKVALLPAILYFLAIFAIVHLEAQKDGVDMNKDGENQESLIEVLKNGWHFAFPILALIVMMVIGYSPFKSAFYSITALVIVYTLSQFSKTKKIDTSIISKAATALKKGAFDTVPIATACAAAGIIAGILSITGLGSKLSTLIISISDGRLIVALMLTMIISIVLGMGLPTTAAYLVLASVVAPALSQMGLSMIAAHMFVFFFGCISTITPPVALASYVAAGIAGTELNKVGWTAFKYGLVSFILPFMFVYGPSLLLEGSMATIIITLIFSIIGVLSIATSIVGFFRIKLVHWQRVSLFISGLLMVNEGYLTDIIGIGLILLIYFFVKSEMKNRIHMTPNKNE